MIVAMARALVLALLGCCLWILPSVAEADQDGSNTPAPAGIAVDAEGNVYVSDYALDRVLKFSPVGAVLAQWGTSGSTVGQFNAPFGVAVDGASTVFVADQLNNRVQRFGTDGMPLGAWGAPGAGPGELRTPFGVAVGSGGRVYVADFGNDRVEVFTSGGTVLNTFGVHGSGDGQFQRPAGVAVGLDGTLYVTDHFNDRVERFAADGRFLAQLGPSSDSSAGVPALTIQPPSSASTSPTSIGLGGPAAGQNGTPTPPPPLDGAPASAQATPNAAQTLVSTTSGSDAQLRRPEGIAVDRDGNVWVADYGHDRVVKLSPDGRLLMSWGSRGSGPGEFVGPKGVAIDPSSGRLYVADTGNARVQRLAPDGTPEASWQLPPLSMSAL
jgi:DNA-binding beta-propeller fold protein YncE